MPNNFSYTPRPCKHGCGLIAMPGPLGRHEKQCVRDYDSLVELLVRRKYINPGIDSLCWLPTTRRLDSRPKICGTRAHYVAYKVTFGPPPEGCVLRHHCDNESCANPYHLVAGTQADNMADMWKRKRGILGGFVNPPRPHTPKKYE